MMKVSKVGYCDNCDKDVSYAVLDETRVGRIRNVEFTYPFKKCVCKQCGAQVFPVSYGKINEIALYDGYKKSVNLLTSKEMIEIRQKLHLSQAKLAKLVGCGAKNIARYENGYIQIRSIDNAIRNLAKKDDYNQSDIELSRNFAELLVKTRKEKHISQEELAKLSNINISDLISIENGTANPTLQVISKLSSCLGKKITIKLN